MAVPNGCSHDSFEDLELEPSPHAKIAGFTRKSEAQRAAAATANGKINKTAGDGMKPLNNNPHVFPGPLILPNDDLALDPKYPPQSVRQWAKLERQHDYDPSRNTIYFAAAPGTAPDARFIQSWTKIQAGTSKHMLKSAPPSMFDNVLEYLQAFYHGRTVKKFDQHLRFVNIEPPSKPKSKSKSTGKRAKPAPTDPATIGLEFDIKGERYVMDIRARTSPHEESPIYPKQLNLDDLLDAAIAMLPEDAYALLLLVDHDIYEDDTDEFACGRAYGGSRVAVVSASRYNPALDETVPELDPEHAWPASHCRDYVQGACGQSSKQAKSKGKAPPSAIELARRPHEDFAMTLAVSAFKKSFDQSSSAPSPASQAGLWLSRVCKTASHELGHCAGMDHCVYYACIMQGTAGLAEDARQPPYLCPVDLAKLLGATGGDEQQRYERIAELCKKDGFKEEGMFSALRVWIENGVLWYPASNARIQEEMQTSCEGFTALYDDPDL